MARRRSLFGVMAVVAVLGIGATAVATVPATPGTLDPSFGTAGYVIDGGLAPGQLVVAAAAVPTTGGVEVVVSVDPDPNDPTALSGPVVMRFDAAGARAAGFGTDATRPGTAALAPLGFDAVDGFVVGTDGTTLVAGVGAAGPKLVRLSDDGTLDTTFGTGGAVDLGAGWPGFLPSAAAVTDLGDIVVAGQVVGATSTGAVLRFDSEGVALPGFGTAGLASFPGEIVAHAVTLDVYGRVVVGGERTDSGTAVLVRLGADGSTDASFGGGSVTVGGADGRVMAVADLPGGRLAVVDATDGDTTASSLRVLDGSGAPDPSFASGAPVALGAAAPGLVAAGVAGDATGAVTVVGAGDNGLVLVRYLADGTVASSVAGAAGSGAGAASVRADGSMLVGGNVTDQSGTDILLARVAGAPVVDSEAIAGYTGVQPARVLDTRTGGGCIDGGATRIVPIAGLGAVPPTGADAVALNVTAVGPTQPGYLTVYPSDAARPTASNVNFVAGQTVPNMVVAKLGADGAVAVFNAAGCTQLVVDVVGWFAGGAPVAGGFTALQPARILDTRSNGGCVGGGQTRPVPVTGAGGVPASGVSAVVLNVTAVGATGPGYLTVFPSGAARPTASSVNFVAGQTVPNLVMAKVGPDGQVSVFNAAGCTNVVVDVVGWYAAGAPVTGGFTGLQPTRLADSRQSGQGGCVAGGQTRVVPVSGLGGVPASGVDSVALNVTAVGPTTPGYLTVYPGGSSRPTASSVNFVAGQTVPNLVIVKVGTDGTLRVFNSSGCTNIVVDVVGWFAA